MPSLYATPLTTAYVLGVAALLGLCMGSFLDCLAWRGMHGESVVRGRSHCDSCGHVLAARDLVPILSWVSLHGRCRYCGTRVSARCPLVEAACGIMFVCIVARYDLTLEALEMLALACVLVVLTLTDLDGFLIPDGCIVAAVGIRIAYILAQDLLGDADVVTTVLASLLDVVVVTVPLVLLVLVMDRVLGRDSMGGGDVKLLAVCALFFGWERCLFLLIVACVSGIVIGLALPAFQARHARPEQVDGREGVPDDDSVPRGSFPFGPAIALACLVTMLCGDGVVGWYLSLF